MKNKKFRATPKVVSGSTHPVRELVARLMGKIQ